MSAGQFEALCHSFCELTGTAPPVLKPYDNGLLAFNTTLRRYTATFIHAPQAGIANAFMVLDIGKMSPEAGVPGWKTLMRVNALMYGTDSPVIGLSASDHLLVQSAVHLHTTTAQGVLATLIRLADWADQWHAGKWLSSELQAESAGLAAAHSF